MVFDWLFKRTYTIHSGAVTAFFHYWCFRVEIKEHLKEVRYSIKQDTHSINCNLLKQCLLPANPLLFQCFPAFLFFLRDFLGFPALNGDSCKSLNYRFKVLQEHRFWSKDIPSYLHFQPKSSCESRVLKCGGDPTKLWFLFVCLADISRVFKCRQSFGYFCRADVLQTFDLSDIRPEW